MAITQFDALNLAHTLTYLLPNNPHEYNILINTDNMASQHLTPGRDVTPTLCACSRQLWLLAAKFNFDLKIVHKPGKDLILADSLSRSSGSDAADVTAKEMCTSLNLNKKHIVVSLNVLDFSL